MEKALICVLINSPKLFAKSKSFYEKKKKKLSHLIISDVSTLVAVDW